MSQVYTINVWERIRGRVNVEAQIAFTSDSYSSGLTVDPTQLNCPSSLDSLLIESASPADSRIFKFDKAASKIRIYAQAASGSGSQYAEVSGNQTVSLFVVAKGW